MKPECLWSWKIYHVSGEEYIPSSCQNLVSVSILGLSTPFPFIWGLCGGEEGEAFRALANPAFVSVTLFSSSDFPDDPRLGKFSSLSSGASCTIYNNLKFHVSGTQLAFSYFVKSPRISRTWNVCISKFGKNGISNLRQETFLDPRNMHAVIGTSYNFFRKTFVLRLIVNLHQKLQGKLYDIHMVTLPTQKWKLTVNSLHTASSVRFVHAGWLPKRIFKFFGPTFYDGCGMACKIMQEVKWADFCVCENCMMLVWYSKVLPDGLLKVDPCSQLQVAPMYLKFLSKSLHEDRSHYEQAQKNVGNFWLKPLSKLLLSPCSIAYLSIYKTHPNSWILP